MHQIKLTKEVQRLISEGAIFYCSHSGGKDSQAMYHLLTQIIPDDQLVVVHADLGEIEWKGVQDHIKATIHHPLNVVRGCWKDGSTKDLLSMVERRHQQAPQKPCWPSSSMRYCTSDLKRDPIHKFIRNDMKAKGATLGVNCTGLRAEESRARKAKKAWAINGRLSNQSRTVWEWLPIHELLTPEVFQVISEAGQDPFWAYQENERLSCVFCIMGCKGDLRHGAKQRPELAKKYIALEIKTGYTMFNGESLAEKLQGII